jgi:threonyl-tRNA synthetase
MNLYQADQEFFMVNQLDHRQLADEMEIFFLDEQIGAGLPVWLPNGVAIREALESFVKALEREGGYHRVVSPHIGKGSLYECSGHLKSFDGNMFPPMKWKEKDGDENAEYFLRPMNCPHHHKVFAALPRSYRQLPLRIAEYGQVYRFENSGSLKGLSRVRGLCQNDAHIYVDPSQAEAEICEVLKLHERCYQALHLKGHRYRLSKSDAKRPQDFDGSAEIWQQAEAILRGCLQKMNLPFFEAEGEAAFYGPKIDVQMKMGANEESVASVQLDFNSGQKFQLQFVNSSGESQVPWIIHRAPLGSHERFVALLLEYYQGQLPGWLAPVQISLIPVGDEQMEFARQLQAELIKKGIRVWLDVSSGSLSKRILFAHRSRPFSKLVIGSKEIQSRKFHLQLRDKQIAMSVSEIVEYLLKSCEIPL